MSAIKSVLFPALIATAVTVVVLRYVAPVRSFALGVSAGKK